MSDAILDYASIVRVRRIKDVVDWIYFEPIKKKLERLVSIYPDFWRLRYYYVHDYLSYFHYNAIRSDRRYILAYARLIDYLLGNDKQNTELGNAARIPVPDEIKKHVEILAFHDDPRSFVADYFEANMLLFEADYDAAEEAAERALTKATKLGYIYPPLEGIIFYIKSKLGKYSEAKEHLKRYVSSHKDHLIMGFLLDKALEDNESLEYHLYLIDTLIIQKFRPLNRIYETAVKAVKKFGRRGEIYILLYDVFSHYLGIIKSLIHSQIIGYIKQCDSLFCRPWKYLFLEKNFKLFKKAIKELEGTISYLVIQLDYNIDMPTDNDERLIRLNDMARELEANYDTNSLLVRKLLSYIYWIMARNVFVAIENFRLKKSFDDMLYYSNLSLKYWPYESAASHSSLRYVSYYSLLTGNTDIIDSIKHRIITTWEYGDDYSLFLFFQYLPKYHDYYWALRASLNVPINESQYEGNVMASVGLGAYKKTMRILVDKVRQEGYDLRDLISQVL